MQNNTFLLIDNEQKVKWIEAQTACRKFEVPKDACMCRG